MLYRGINITSISCPALSMAEQIEAGSSTASADLPTRTNRLPMAGGKQASSIILDTKTSWWPRHAPGVWRHYLPPAPLRYRLAALHRLRIEIIGIVALASVHRARNSAICELYVIDTRFCRYRLSSLYLLNGRLAGKLRSSGWHTSVLILGDEISAVEDGDHFAALAAACFPIISSVRPRLRLNIYRCAHAGHLAKAREAIIGGR